MVERKTAKLVLGILLLVLAYFIFTYDIGLFQGVSDWFIPDFVESIVLQFKTIISVIIAFVGVVVILKKEKKDGK